MQGQDLGVMDILPASDPVNGGRLLDTLLHTLRHYMALTEEAALTIALWAFHAHAQALFEISPRLALLSPEKRCGKTTLLELLAGLTPRALLTSNITTAAIFR